MSSKHMHVKIEYPFEKPEPPDLEGYLLKMKHKQSVFGSWVKRYFKINSDLQTLDYYHGKSSADNVDESPSKSFSLEDIKSVKKFDANCIQIESYKSGVLMLKCSSAAEQESWVSELSQYLTAYRDYEHKVRVYEIEERTKQLENDS